MDKLHPSAAVSLPWRDRGVENLPDANWAAMSALHPQATGGSRPIADISLSDDSAGMHNTTAYERRTTLSIGQLERLRAQLVDEVEKYQVAIRGYSPEKLSGHGTPHLAKLQARVAEIDGLIAGKA